jgi:hypothetical protein
VSRYLILHDIAETGRCRRSGARYRHRTGSLHHIDLCARVTWSKVQAPTAIVPHTARHLPAQACAGAHP